MICSLSTTLFYQNCSEIENTSASMVRTDFSYLPLYTNELKMISTEVQKSNCGKINEVLYSETHNLCFEVLDSCGYAALLEHGFKVVSRPLDEKFEESQTSTNEDQQPSLEERVKNCQIFVDIADLKPSDFVISSSVEVGYQPNPDIMCSQSLEYLVNFKSRACVLATDGCQSGFLKKNGYVKDYFSVCPDSF